MKNLVIKIDSVNKTQEDYILVAKIKTHSKLAFF